MAPEVDFESGPRPIDIRTLARRQRWLMWLLLASMLLLIPTSSISIANSQSTFIRWLIGAVYVAAYLVIDFLLLMVLAAKNEHRRIMVLYGLLMLAPCVNLFILAVVLCDVNLTLRRARLRVGLFGVDTSEVERLLNPQLCQNCSYDLHGNVSGTCPECGRNIA